MGAEVAKSMAAEGSELDALDTSKVAGKRKRDLKPTSMVVSKVANLDWRAALESLGGNEMNKTPNEVRRPGIHTFIAMLRQPIDRGPPQVRQRYLAHAMKNIGPLMVILEAAPDTHLRWLAAQAIAAYGTFLMQRFWTSRDFCWGNRWDSVIPHAMVLLESRQPFMKRAVSWLGAVWAGDVR